MYPRWKRPQLLLLKLLNIIISMLFSLNQFPIKLFATFNHPNGLISLKNWHDCSSHSRANSSQLLCIEFESRTSRCKVNAWIFQLAFLSKSANKSKKMFKYKSLRLIYLEVVGWSKNLQVLTVWLFRHKQGNRSHFFSLLNECIVVAVVIVVDVKTHTQKTSHNLLFYLLYINGINPIHSLYACSAFIHSRPHTRANRYIWDPNTHCFHSFIELFIFLFPHFHYNTIDETMDHSLLPLIECITAHLRPSEEKLTIFPASECTWWHQKLLSP